MSDEISLECGTANARITLVGAELQEWSVGGSQILWDGNPAFWAARSPVLFPVVGWTRGGTARVASHSYPLSLHGFAKDCRFEVVAGGKQSVRLALRDDRTTQELYPFSFLLELEYRLSVASLVVEIVVTNTGAGPMPYAAGLHPGFRWPLPGGQGSTHSVIFEREERPEVPVIAPGGLFSSQLRPVELAGRELRLSDRTFSREALCFVGAASRSLALCRRRRVAGYTICATCPIWSCGAGPKHPSFYGRSGRETRALQEPFISKSQMAVLEAGEVGRHAMEVTFHRERLTAMRRGGSDWAALGITRTVCRRLPAGGFKNYRAGF